ncbi:MAG TPA: AAA family ATPase, partial [Agitococcus sp.]|nr:AAA family ATPase [Agitococcus sp.]
GLSPRGLLALKRATQAWAFIEGRNYTIPEDVQAVLPAVAEHRLRGSMEDQQKMHSLTSQLLNAVDVIE